MPIPGFTASGDLPVGVHQVTLTEVITRFGRSTPQRIKRDRSYRGIVEVIAEEP
jgi:hypothetical protein